MEGRREKDVEAEIGVDNVGVELEEEEQKRIRRVGM